MTGTDLEAHRHYLGAVLYRLTGDAAEADDLVQETFARALAHPEVTADADRPLRPWLLRVAVRLGLDALRARRNRSYPGIWLPTPLPTGEEVCPDDDPGARYELLESASLAFLVALEALSPQQRAVVVLREVFDLSVEETAAILESTTNSVKVAHHHARAALASYDAERLRPTRAAQQRAESLLSRFLAAVAAGDAPAARALLSPEVTAIGDGAGRYLAGLRPIVGAERVARLYLHFAGRTELAPRLALVMANGLPALLVRVDDPTGRAAPVSLLQLVPSPGEDRIARVYSIQAPHKLGALLEADPGR